MSESNEVQTDATLPAYINTKLMNRDRTVAGNMGRANIPLLIQLLTQGGDIAATIEHNHFLGVSGCIRNHFKADRGTEFPDYESVMAANQVAADARGGNAEGLLRHKAALKSLLTTAAASGKSAAACAKIKALSSNLAGLALSSPIIKGKMAIIVEAWAATLDDETVIEYDRTLTRLLEACVVVEDDEGDDF